MKFTVNLSRDGEKAEHSYSFGEFPGIQYFLGMSDPLISNVKMENFNAHFLSPAYHTLHKASGGFSSSGYYVSWIVRGDSLLTPGPPVYISIHLESL